MHVCVSVYLLIFNVRIGVGACISDDEWVWALVGIHTCMYACAHVCTCVCVYV